MSTTTRGGTLHFSRWSVADPRPDAHPFAQPRSSRHGWLRWGAILATGSLAACAVGPDYQRPGVALTPSFMQSPALAPEDGASTQRWWRAFGDVDLDADRELLAASDQLATTRAESALAAVASYRALGGGWPG